MTLPWREHPAASAEGYDAAEWYAEKDPELAERFADSLRQSVEVLCEWPEAGSQEPWVDRMPLVRSMRVKGFPYRIVYVIHSGSVVVVAYAHERRRPGYWKARLDDV